MASRSQGVARFIRGPPMGPRFYSELLGSCGGSLGRSVHSEGAYRSSGYFGGRMGFIRRRSVHSRGA